jgi:hypothetical protein
MSMCVDAKRTPDLGVLSDSRTLTGLTEDEQRDLVAFLESLTGKTPNADNGIDQVSARR